MARVALHGVHEAGVPRVGLVVAYGEAGAAQALPQRPRERHVLVIEDADVERARRPVEDGREAVHREEEWAHAAQHAPVDEAIDLVVVWHVVALGARLHVVRR